MELQCYVTDENIAVLVTGSREPWECDESRQPFSLENRLKNVTQVLKRMRLPRFKPQEDF
jgi:hypothetical protein